MVYKIAPGGGSKTPISSRPIKFNMLPYEYAERHQYITDAHTYDRH